MKSDKYEKFLNNNNKEIAKTLHSQIENKKFNVKKELYNENTKRFEVVDLDIEITINGLKESLNKGKSVEKIALIEHIDELIKTSKDGIISKEQKERTTNEMWYYLFNTAKINNKLYGVKVDIKRVAQGDRFYVHRVNLIEKEGNPNSQVHINENNMIKTKGLPSNINNSISNFNENVNTTKF